MVNLETTYLGIKLKNPLIASSCGLTNSIINIKKLADNGIGAIVIKSMFEEQIHIETEKYIKDEHGSVKTFNNALPTPLRCAFGLATRPQR